VLRCYRKWKERWESSLYLFLGFYNPVKGEAGNRRKKDSRKERKTKRNEEMKKE